MPQRPGCHLDYDDRCAIEEGVAAGLSAAAIARRLDVSTSSVTREVRSNRWAREPKRKSVRPSRKCALYDGCRRKRTACDECAMGDTGRYACRLCPAAACCDSCPDFEPRECELVRRWPYVCRCEPNRRARCDLPKFRYDARRAQKASDGRRRESRSGISIGEDELESMLELVVPLIRQGHSPEAVWMSHPGEMPVSCRTFRAWMEDGVVDVPAILLPRKVRCRPRGKKRARPAPRPGREYSDFLALPAEERVAAVEMDSVIGLARNEARLLSVHVVRAALQFYVLLPSAGSAPVVDALDMLERALGGPWAFSAAMGVVLTDRGEEFSDWERMERSCTVFGERRCRVFYCDPLSPGQKGHCERNHSELRRILPKKRSDFDELSERDLSLAASHIASYPRELLGGKRPIDAARAMLPDGMLDALGIEEIPIEEVVLRPSLLPHAVEQ